MAERALRILVFPETPRMWVARGLEHDFSTAGRTMESAIDTFLKVAAAHVAYDCRHHHLPLSAFAAAPPVYWDAFARATPLSIPLVVPWSDGGTPAHVIAAVAQRNPAIRWQHPPSQRTA